MVRKCRSFFRVGHTVIKKQKKTVKLSPITRLRAFSNEYSSDYIAIDMSGIDHFHDNSITQNHHVVPIENLSVKGPSCFLSELSNDAGTIRNVPNSDFPEIDPLEDAKLDEYAFPVKGRLISQLSVEEFLALFNLSHLSHPLASKVKKILINYRDVFALSAADFENPDVPFMSIPTSDETPIFKKQYPLSQKVLPFVQSEIKEMISTGLISPCKSEYNAPIHVVPKRSGELRIVTDYRLLNKTVIDEKFPLPNLHEVLQKVGGKKFYSKFDLKQGYHQIKLDPADRHKTAFQIGDDKLQYNVVPPGIKNAVSSFQFIMRNHVWEELYGTVIHGIMDDAISGSDDEDEHLSHIQKILSRLRARRLKLHPNKCTFAASTVSFLGHQISRQGMEPDPSHIASVHKYSQPKNRKAVMRFLGFCNFYRDFIPKFAHIATPLYKLTSPYTKFIWTKEAEAAFTDLKTKLTSQPILHFPYPGKPFYVDCDASKDAVGGCIMQEGDKGILYPVAYVSKKLTTQQSLWSNTERELYAIFQTLLMAAYTSGQTTNHSCPSLRTRFKVKIQQLN